MNKFFLFFFIFVLVLGSVSAQIFGVEVTEGDDGGILIVEFKEKEFNLLDLFQPQAIIPLYVDAGSTIQFKGELAKVSDFTGFLFGSPDKLIIRIYKFDSTKPNFLGDRVNTFTIIIPESARQSISNPLTTILIFDAQMTAPTIIGKYRYEAEPRFGNFREPSIQLDYDTFNVQVGVPEICTLPSTETTFQDITNGKLKIITLTEYVSLDCIKSTRITYNAICDDGYKTIGSGADSRCEKIITPPTLPPPVIGCSDTQVCCKVLLFVNDERLVQFPDGIIHQCTPPSDCGFFKKYPQSSAVPNVNCGGEAGSGSGAAIICGDGKKEGAEECDDNNNVNGDGCSFICKLEIDGGNIIGILEEQLDDKTEDELEDSACKRTSDCEKGASCIPFDKLSSNVRERLAGGLFNIAEDGICVFPEPEKEGFDIGNLGCTIGESLGIQGDNKCGIGWGILIGIIFLFIVLITRRK